MESNRPGSGLWINDKTCSWMLIRKPGSAGGVAHAMMSRTGRWFNAKIAGQLRKKTRIYPKTRII